MAALATGVVVKRQIISAAVWVNGVGRALGSFPNTSAGVEQLVQRLTSVGAEQRVADVHLVLEPSNGTELLIVAVAAAQDWPVTIPDPERFARWSADLGYGSRAGGAGALQLARYAAMLPLPTRQELLSETATPQERLATDQEIRSQPVADFQQASPVLAEQARQLRQLPGVNDINMVPLLGLLQRWPHAPASGGLTLSQKQPASLPTGPHILERLRTLHPLAILGIVLVVLLRFVWLDTLPGDLYGDIAIIIDYVSNIFSGKWPTYFDLSTGPLYHYLITPLLALTGLTYYGIKLASVLTSLVTLACTYGLASDLIDEECGLIAGFVVGVSCWFLIFSRLGNSQILVPLLAIGSVYLAAHGIRRRKSGLVVAAALVAVGGLYTYPQSFIIPGVTGLVLLWLVWIDPRRPWRDLWIYAGVCALGILPFLAIIYRDLNAFMSGYVGDKLPVGGEWSDVLRENLWRTLLALHVQGDRTFRSNPNSLPELDVLSGILLLVGLAFWLIGKRRTLAPVVLIPLLLLPIPSMLVRYTAEVPSASRALGAVPFICIVVAGGLRWLVEGLRRRPAIRHSIIASVLGVMLLLNSYRYFVVYANGLPNHNIAFGRVISTYIDALPPDYAVVVIGCCWGDAGQPHPYAIQYDVHVPRSLALVPTDKATCDLLRATPRPISVIWGLIDGPPAPQLATCLESIPRTLQRDPSGEPVFYTADLPP